MSSVIGWLMIFIPVFVIVGYYMVKGKEFRDLVYLIVCGVLVSAWIGFAIWLIRDA